MEEGNRRFKKKTARSNKDGRDEGVGKRNERGGRRNEKTMERGRGEVGERERERGK